MAAITLYYGSLKNVVESRGKLYEDCPFEIGDQVPFIDVWRK